MRNKYVNLVLLILITCFVGCSTGKYLASEQELFHPIVSNDKEEVERLLSLNVDLSIRLEEGDMTPLMAACFFGHLDIVKMLIDHGVDVNEVNEVGLSALHAAEYVQDKSIASYLRSVGAKESVIPEFPIED